MRKRLGWTAIGTFKENESRESETGKVCLILTRMEYPTASPAMTSISGLCPADPAQGTLLKRHSPQAPSLSPSKVSLIFSLPWIQVIAPRPLSQAPRNVTNSLPSFTGPVTWEVFIAQQPVSLSCGSAALP